MKGYLIGVTLIFALYVSACVGEDEKKKEDYGTVIGIDLGTTYSW